MAAAAACALVACIVVAAAPSSFGAEPPLVAGAGTGAVMLHARDICPGTVRSEHDGHRAEPRRLGPRDSDSPGGWFEMHRIRFIDRMFGAVSVSTDHGCTWRRIGRVLRPLPGECKTIGPREFTAADWAPVGAVAATAVNAIHVKVAQPEPHAAVFSILPLELAPGRDRPASYFDSRSTLFTDMPAGTGVFGCTWSPTVGSPWYLEDALTGRLTRPAEGYAPSVGDRFVIIARRAMPEPRSLLFENRFDGAVIARFHRNETRVVARVLRPVTGTGRFGGSRYLGPGLLRANHPGVICVSTSPVGELGGFQIVPATHASDPELSYVRQIPAWMVVGPAGSVGGHGASSRPLEGAWPLFLGSLRPCEWVALLRRGGSEDFEEMPELSGKRLSALVDVDAILLVRASDKERILAGMPIADSR